MPMPHRTGDQYRIKIAHDGRIDEVRTATENAYRAIAAGEYRNENRLRRERGPREEKPLATWKEPSVLPIYTHEQITARFARQAVTPHALDFPCIEHGAHAGEYCWNRDAKGVCGARWNRGLSRKVGA